MDEKLTWLKSLWTKPYYGVSHLCPWRMEDSWGSINEYNGFVIVHLRRFYTTKEYQVNTVSEGKDMVEKHISNDPKFME